MSIFNQTAEKISAETIIPKTMKAVVAYEPGDYH